MTFPCPRGIRNPALFALLVAVSTAFSQAPDEEKSTESVPHRFWFGDLQKPMSLGKKGGDVICRYVYDSLRAGELAPGLPEDARKDSQPRIVALSWTDGHAPTQIIFGSGEGIVGALDDALRRAFALGTDTSHTRWVKLDVVQHATNFPQFHVRFHPFPAPGLVGIAFSRESGLAFLAEALVGLDAIDRDRLLRVELIEEVFALSDRVELLDVWGRIANSRTPQSVFFFETQGFFCQDGETFRLFRGHKIQEPTTLRAVGSAIREDAAFLARVAVSRPPFLPQVQFQRRDLSLVERKVGEEDDKKELRRVGTTEADRRTWEIRQERAIPLEVRPGVETITRPLPHWTITATHPATLGDAAGSALALFAANELFPDPMLVRGADATLDHILDHQQPCKFSKKARCVVDAKSHTKSLGTNALTALALLSQPPGPNREARMPETYALAHFLVGMLKPDGRFVIDAPPPLSGVEPAPVEDAARAIVALVGYYELTKNPGFLRSAQRALNTLMEVEIGERSLTHLPRSEWLVAACEAVNRHAPEPKRIVQMQHFILAAIAAQTMKPPIPDLLGSFDAHPSTVHAARHTMLLAKAGRVVAGPAHRDAASVALAAIHHALMFQLQARMDPASALYLANPLEYVGAVRDDCVNLYMSPGAQWRHLLSLVEAHKLFTELGHDPDTVLPLHDTSEELLRNARIAMARFPRYLH